MWAGYTMTLFLLNRWWLNWFEFGWICKYLSIQPKYLQILRRQCCLILIADDCTLANMRVTSFGPVWAQSSRLGLQLLSSWSNFPENEYLQPVSETHIKACSFLSAYVLQTQTDLCLQMSGALRWLNIINQKVSKTVTGVLNGFWYKTEYQCFGTLLQSRYLFNMSKTFYHPESDHAPSA